MRLALLALSVVMAGCSASFGRGGSDVDIDIPEVRISIGQDEHRGRVHLQRHWVQRGTRYCQYSNGQTYQRHWRYECPRFY